VSGSTGDWELIEKDGCSGGEQIEEREEEGKAKNKTPSALCMTEAGLAVARQVGRKDAEDANDQIEYDFIR